MNLKVLASLRKQSHFRFSRNELDRTHVTKHYHTSKVRVTHPLHVTKRIYLLGINKSACRGCKQYVSCIDVARLRFKLRRHFPERGNPLYRRCVCLSFFAIGVQYCVALGNCFGSWFLGLPTVWSPRQRFLHPFFVYNSALVHTSDLSSKKCTLFDLQVLRINYFYFSCTHFSIP